MGKARDFIPALRFGNKIYPEDLAFGNPWSNYWYVDGDNGSDSAYNGSAVDKSVKTIQKAVDNASNWDVIFVKPKVMATGATDPSNYAENIIIPATHEGLQIIGVGTGRVQGGLPQIKPGGTTASTAITVRAPACRIANIGINGISAAETPAVQNLGILLDDDASTKTAFGTTIENCHFKNCAGSTITNAATGGAINWATTGAAWQVLIRGNRFYKNVGDVVLLGTSVDVPQDVIIEDNIFSGPAANVDCNLYLAGGSGMNGVVIDSNIFQQLPALGGTNDRFIVATGCTGMLTRNMFGALVSEGSTEKTFEANGTGAKIPTTMHMAGNYGQFETGTGAGLISGEIFA